MNMNRDVLSGSDLEMPSGCEVESATFHAPLAGGAPTEVVPSRSGRLTALKGKLHQARHVVRDRTSMIGSSMRSGVGGSMTKMQTSMRDSPMKWAGIAAGSGLAIGLVGRVLHWRNQHHRHIPQLVIIDAC